MNQRKPNRSLWYSLGLASLLCIAFLVTATGPALARYRSEREVQLTYEVRPPERIALGTLRPATADEATEDRKEGDLIFDASILPEWETVDGGMQMDLVVANGVSDTVYSARDQKLTVRLVGTVGLPAPNQTQTSEDPEAAAETQTAENPFTVTLVLPPESAGGTPTKLQAVQTPIIPGTPLYTTVGEGWIFTFVNEEGVEPFWMLPGGKWNWVTITLTMQGEAAEAAMLSYQVMAEVIDE